MCKFHRHWQKIRHTAASDVNRGQVPLESRFFPSANLRKSYFALIVHMSSATKPLLDTNSHRCQALYCQITSIAWRWVSEIGMVAENPRRRENKSDRAREDPRLARDLTTVDIGSCCMSYLDPSGLASPSNRFPFIRGPGFETGPGIFL